MEEKKNLCAPIPLSLHQRLRAEQAQRGQTLADYITDILNEHFEGGEKTMGKILWNKELKIIIFCKQDPVSLSISR